MKEKKELVIIIMCVAIVLMGAVYSLLSTKLNVVGMAGLTETWGVKITEITSTATGRAYNINDPIYTDTSMTFKVGVKEPGDKMTFSVTIQNYGSLDAILTKVDASDSGSYVIKYSIEGINEQEKLVSGESITFTVTTEFDIEAIEIPSSPVKDLEISLLFVQDMGEDEELTPPEIENDKTLVYAVLSNNLVQADSTLNLTESTSFASSYSINKSGITSLNFGLTTTKYYFSNSYSFDESTGEYYLTGDKMYSTWENMSSNFTGYPYTCRTVIDNDGCNYIYQMVEYTSSTTGLGYTYSAKANTVTNGEGLYYTNVNTENNEKTYYFRGNVTNNYVSFAGILWRIVRINEDGSIKLITENAISEAAFSETDGDNAYVGYMRGLPESTTLYGDIAPGYGTLSPVDYSKLNSYIAGNATLTDEQVVLADVNLDGIIDSTDSSLVLSAIRGETTLPYASDILRYQATHKNRYDSTVKATLDSWYSQALSSFSAYISDTGFCNDRSMASQDEVWNVNDTALGYGTNGTYYGANNRVYRKKEVQFACPQQNDLFTMASNANGNGALTNPVGLITADEVIYAGGMGYEHYLENGTSFLTMSPYLGGSSSGLFVYFSMWTIDADSVSSPHSIRPVINLNSDVKVSSGDGSFGTPYIIETVVQ